MQIKGFLSYISFGVFYKLSGFMRIILQIRYLSDSESSDIFWQSNKILAVCRRPVISGTFQSIFSLYYEKHKFQKKEKEFSAFCLVYLTLFFTIIAFVILCSYKLFASFLKIENISLFHKNLMFFFPIIPGMFLLYFFKSLNDIQGNFLLSSSSPTIGNILFILCILCFAKLQAYFIGFLVGLYYIVFPK